MAATLKIPTIFTAVDKMSSVVRTMGKNIKKSFRGSLNAVKRFDQKVTRSFKKMGSMAQLGLGVGVGMFFTDAIGKISGYEQSLADLSAVMNTSRKNQNLLSKDAQRLGSNTAKSAIEVVGLQEAYARLGFTTPEILNMTEGTIAGSIAMNAELAQTAELTGAVVKTFDNFSSIDAPDILDKMTLATQKSALNFAKLETALPIVGGASNAAGISFERTLAILGKLSDAGIDASSSATALRNIFLESAKNGDNYEQVLERISKNQNKLTAANDKFGKRAAVSSTILAGKLKETANLTELLSNKTEVLGASNKAASTRLNTFKGDVTLLKSAYEGLLLGINDGTGALGIFRTIIQFVTKNIKTIAIVIAGLIGLFLAMKVIVGVMQLISVAMKVWTAITWLATIAQEAFDIAMYIGLGPILLVIAAIIAIILIFKNWTKITAWFSKQWTKFTTLLKFAWGNIVKFFKDFSFTDFFKSIGQSILSFLLLPLKSVLFIVSKLPGKLGKLASSGLEKISELTGGGDINVNNKKALNSAEVTASNTTIETIKKNNISIDIKDKGNNVEKVTNNGDLSIPIKTTPTQGAN